jgi:hypothetical protein
MPRPLAQVSMAWHFLPYELYTMMRYLQYDTLQERGLSFFDSWAATFGETITATELAPEGNGFRQKTRFARFFNLPELLGMWKEAADIQTADMLKLPVPEVEYINVVTKPSEFQKAELVILSDRADVVRNQNIEPEKDNLLKITNDGRKLALDQRVLNPNLPDDPGSKINACIKNIMDVWEESAADRCTQLVFCDLSTPHYDGKFNVYDDIKSKLILKGVPEDEIAFIHDANTETQKAELFAKVRKGQVRVLLGSTAKLGAGTNVQDRIIALHHLDCPWKPRDIEQQEGRALRQGNRNKKIYIFRYVTESTFDAYNWSLIENKQKFIGQIMTSKSPARSCEDVDDRALTYAEIKALATGDPRIKEKMDLDIEVIKLKMLKSSYMNQHFRLEDSLIKYFPPAIQGSKERIAGLEADIKILAKNTPRTAESFSMEVESTVYAEKKDAGYALLAACKQLTDPKTVLPVGHYRGFALNLQLNCGSTDLLLKNDLTYRIELGTDVFGNITRINNALDELPKKLEQQRFELDNLNQQVENAKDELKKPFLQGQELLEKTELLNQLNIELTVHDNNSGEETVVNEEMTEEEMEEGPDLAM